MSELLRETVEAHRRQRANGLGTLGIVLAAFVVFGAFWGFHSGAQAADGAFESRSVSAGTEHTCAYKDSGAAFCWGWNPDGRLGNGTNDDSPVPSRVVNLPDVVEISSGQYNGCAIRSSGQAFCWGYNGHGSVGDGTQEGEGPYGSRDFPTPVVGLSDAVAISAGDANACAIRQSGQAVCWGINTHGQLGDGTTETRLVPTPVDGLDDATAISIGLGHSCAIRESGQAVCWGLNFVGQLGDGTSENRLAPTPVEGLEDTTAISVGKFHTCAIKGSGEPVCWGYNVSGQLGDGTYIDSNTATPVEGIPEAVAITTSSSLNASYDHSCAIDASGQAFCWGGNGNGQLGIDSWDPSNPEPTPVYGLADAEVISAGGHHTCAVRQSGETLCWGLNDYGQLGDGSVIERRSPYPVSVPDLGVFELSVETSGDGSGTVTSDPAGIDCGEDCVAEFPADSQVRLIATPDEDSTFEGWTGCPDVEENGDCVVTMDGGREVSAEFALIPDPNQPFILTLNYGLFTLGDWSDLGVDDAGDPVTLEGSWNSATGELMIPAAGVSGLTAGLPGPGSVTFTPNGTHLAGSWNPVNGALTVRGPFRADFTIGGLNCRATQNFRFSTDRTVPYRGTRFAGGLDGQGAVVVAWEDLGSIRGDAGCADLASQLSTAGGMWLSHEIEPPSPPEPPVGPLELTPPTLIDSSGELATQITPGRRLICVAGTWSNVTRGTFAWKKNDGPFSNLKADGAGSDVYRPTAADIGSTFSCHQVMRNDQVRDVAGSSSNSALVVANP